MESGRKTSLISKGCPSDLKADTGVPQGRTQTAALAQASFEQTAAPCGEVGAWVASQPFGVASRRSPTSTITPCHGAGWLPQGPKKRFPPRLLQWVGSTVLLVICRGRFCGDSLLPHQLTPWDRSRDTLVKLAKLSLRTSAQAAAKGLLCLTQLLPGARSGGVGYPKGARWRIRARPGGHFELEGKAQDGGRVVEQWQEGARAGGLQFVTSPEWHWSDTGRMGEQTFHAIRTGHSGMRSPL